MYLQLLVFTVWVYRYLSLIKTLNPTGKACLLSAFISDEESIFTYSYFLESNKSLFQIFRKWSIYGETYFGLSGTIASNIKNKVQPKICGDHPFLYYFHKSTKHTLGRCGSKTNIFSKM